MVMFVWCLYGEVVSDIVCPSVCGRMGMLSTCSPMDGMQASKQLHTEVDSGRRTAQSTSRTHAVAPQDLSVHHIAPSNADPIHPPAAQRTPRTVPPRRGTRPAGRGETEACKDRTCRQPCTYWEDMYVPRPRGPKGRAAYSQKTI